MAKLFASEIAMEIALNAMRIHGGYGYSTEFDVERYFRDAPLMIVGEGTNEIQRNVIARQLVTRGGLRTLTGARRRGNRCRPDPKNMDRDDARAAPGDEGPSGRLDGRPRARDGTRHRSMVSPLLTRSTRSSHPWRRTSETKSANGERNTV